MWIGVVPKEPPGKDTVPEADGLWTNLPGAAALAKKGVEGAALGFLLGERGPGVSALVELFLFFALTLRGTPEMEAKLSWFGIANVASWP